MNSVESGRLTNEELLSIVTIHSHNVTEECDVCKEIGEQFFYDLFEQIYVTYANSMSSELVDALASNYEWEPGGDLRTPYRVGVYERRMLVFVLHPLSSLENLTKSPDYFSEAIHHDWVNEAVSEEELEAYILQFLDAVVSHPKVTAEVQTQWMASIHEFLSDMPMVCESGPAEDCIYCNSLMARARQTLEKNSK